MNDILKSLEGLYLEGKFEEAASLLIKNKDKFDKGLFHYNLGTVMAKSNDFAAGRFHFEKAIKLGYVNSKTMNNLEAVKYQLAVKDISNSGDFFSRMSTDLKLFGGDIFNLFTLLLLIIFMSSVIKKWLINKVAIALIFLFCFVPSLLYYGHLKKINVAIGMKNAKIFEGPSEVYDLKGELPAGSKVIITEIREGWFFISGPLFLSGWVKKEKLGIF